MAGRVVVLPRDDSARRQGLQTGALIAQSLAGVSNLINNFVEKKEAREDDERNTLLRAVNMFGVSPNDAPPSVRNRLAKLLKIDDLPFAQDGGVHFPESTQMEIQRYKDNNELMLRKRAADGDPVALNKIEIMDGLRKPEISEGDKAFTREIEGLKTKRMYAKAQEAKNLEIFKNANEIAAELRKQKADPKNQASGYSLMRDNEGKISIVGLADAQRANPRAKELTHAQVQEFAKDLSEVSNAEAHLYETAEARVKMMKMVQGGTEPAKIMEMAINADRLGLENAEALGRLAADMFVAGMFAEDVDPNKVDLVELANTATFLPNDSLAEKTRAIERFEPFVREAVKKRKGQLAALRKRLDNPTFVDNTIATKVAGASNTPPTDPTVMSAELKEEIDRQIQLGSEQGFSAAAITGALVAQAGNTPDNTQYIRQRVLELFGQKSLKAPPVPE